MKAYLSLSVVAFVLGSIATIACSSSNADSTPVCQDDSDCQDDDSRDAGKSKSTSSKGDPEENTSGPTGSPKPGDAGPDVGKPDASKPPSDQDCTDLSDCCENITDFNTKLACVGIVFAADPEQCVDAMPQCKAGGGTLGQLFASDHPKCSALATCCTKFHDDGYDTTATDCQEWVETADETQCQQTIDEYQSYGECY